MFSFAGCGKKEAKIPVIGISQYGEHASLDNCREGFLEGLKEAGFEEGKNLEVSAKSAQGNDATNVQIAQSFVSDKMDLVCGIATPSAMALYNACYERKIPVIFNAVSDPVQAKLAKSATEAMPGISGISDALPVAQQLKLIRDILPDAKKVGIVYTTSEPNSVYSIGIYEDLAADYGFTIEAIGVTAQSEVTQAVDTLISQGVDCISNLTDNNVVGVLGSILEKTNEVGIPVYGSEIEQVELGCVAGAGLDYVQLGIQTGKMAAQILTGEATCADLPYETIENYGLYVNSSALTEMGLTLPDDVAQTAEEVGPTA